MGRPTVPRAVLPDSDDVGVGRNDGREKAWFPFDEALEAGQLHERTRLAPSGTKENRGPRIMTADQPPRPPDEDDDDDKRKAPETPPDEPRPQPVQDSARRSAGERPLHGSLTIPLAASRCLFTSARCPAAFSGTLNDVPNDYVPPARLQLRGLGRHDPQVRYSQRVLATG